MSFFSGFKKLVVGVGGITEQGSVVKKLPKCLQIDVDPNDHWNFIGEIGDGAFGKVYKARHKENGKEAAAKMVKFKADEDLNDFRIEIDILSESSHPNVLSLLDAFCSDRKLWLLLEYCDGGAVDNLMLKLGRPLTEPQIAYMAAKVSTGLSYLHETKVIHRDIKAGNILLTSQGGVKLADFGVSTKNKHTMDKHNTFIGTPYWMAPEVIMCDTNKNSQYDYKVDIWSFGVTLIECAEMKPPHHEFTPMRVVLKIQRGEPPKLIKGRSFSPQFNEFIAKCLDKDPKNRPTAQELEYHPFVTKATDSQPIRDLVKEYRTKFSDVVPISDLARKISQSKAPVPVAVLKENNLNVPAKIPPPRPKPPSILHLRESSIERSIQNSRPTSPLSPTQHNYNIKKRPAPRPPVSSTSGSIDLIDTPLTSPTSSHFKGHERSPPSVSSIDLVESGFASPRSISPETFQNQEKRSPSASVSSLELVESPTENVPKSSPIGSVSSLDYLETPANSSPSRSREMSPEVPNSDTKIVGVVRKNEIIPRVPRKKPPNPKQRQNLREQSASIESMDSIGITNGGFEIDISDTTNSQTNGAPSREVSPVPSETVSATQDLAEVPNENETPKVTQRKKIPVLVLPPSLSDSESDSDCGSDTKSGNLAHFYHESILDDNLSRLDRAPSNEREGEIAETKLWRDINSNHTNENDSIHHKMEPQVNGHVPNGGLPVHPMEEEESKDDRVGCCKCWRNSLNFVRQLF